MKSIKSYIKFSSSLLVMIAMTACSDSAPNAELNVVTSGSFKAGEPVVFSITGNADNIVFYSGETGHEYELRDRLYADNDLLVEFVSYTDQSSDIHPNFNVLISSDFNGIYDAEHVTNASWIDVTDKFTLPSVIKTNTPSGVVNLKDYTGGENSLTYIAFRYYDLNNVPINNRWVVRSIDIKKVSPEGQTSSLADIKTAGWQNVMLSGTSKWTLPGTQLLAAGNTSTSNKDFWAISKGFDIKSAVPSTGIVLKNIATTLPEYSYIYDKPGTYEAVFASTSEWYNSKNSSITKVLVTITD